MESSKLSGVSEECSSSESGWTMYLASPMHDAAEAETEDEDGEENYGGESNDDNDQEDDHGSHGTGSGDNYDDDGDSLTSDASSAPPHHCDKSRPSGGVVPKEHSEGKVGEVVKYGNRKFSGHSFKKAHEVVNEKREACGTPVSPIANGATSRFCSTYKVRKNRSTSI